MRRVTLYTKPGCHLCDDVAAVIAEVRKRHAFDFEERNIRNDRRDFERYQFAIPVVAVDGREIARFRLSAEMLVAALQDNAFVQNEPDSGSRADNC